MNAVRTIDRGRRMRVKNPCMPRPRLLLSLIALVCLSATLHAGEPSHVRVYRAATLLAGATAPDQDLDPFGAVLANGVFVG